MGILTWLANALSNLTVVGAVLTGVWVLVLFAFPLIERPWGKWALRLGVIVGVVLQAAAAVALLGPAWGWLRTAGTALAVVLLAWTAEFVGSRTGIPFGRYHYTEWLQPQLGHVPLLIPLAWLMMLPAAWAVADLITGERGLAFIAVSALAFAAWDLFLDPQMVGWGLWVWERRGGYFGIPWVNFAGWVLVSAIVTAIVQPGPLPTAPLALLYALTWLLETVGLAVFWRQPGPALCGFVGMGGMLLWAGLRM
jgi:uncharacterized membrane protein